MGNSQLFQEETLDRYAELYRLLGVIELTLRERIPATLSSNSKNLNWVEVVGRDPYRAAELNRFQVKKANPLIEKLPFGFWCRLFVPKNYTKVSRAGLFAVFPQTDTHMGYSGYLALCHQFKRLNRLRNCVAHYQFHESSHHSKDLELIHDVLRLMGREFRVN
jgi:hypothetical protein